MINENKTTFKVILIKSLIGRQKKHKECAKGLGLRKICQSVEVIDTPSNRGMANKIHYMVKIDG